ncbi:arylamine N-acetyltransferase family protein [Streptomyces litchfieldiae]|uniref:Arylamine N-acetyltransferase n=1 Tax=Streptomyces litchfieldiae TaxID=3075543 RepID=A0ABU2MVZ1_9ACTN|nr:arylamine N-acetyltransferase [Streptomyces sp. DSM 44938]MDT0345816.1 arylamine N-acetyltransferase [Streptomyces sp. DSM 44938]
MGDFDFDVDAYLERIGAERPKRVDYEALCYLQERHMMSVPFETVDLILKEFPSLRDEQLYDKIVRRRRGGGCGELNTAFALLLKGLGYPVTILGARVLHNGKHAFHGQFMGHMVLRVELDQPYLVDVGFRWASRKPLRLRGRGVQKDAHGEYELFYSPDGDLEMVHNGVLRWRAEMHPREIEDFDGPLWFLWTSPDAPATTQLWASIVTPGGRVSMFNRVLTEYENGERKFSRVLEDDAEFLQKFETLYGIRLDAVPDLPVTTEGV